MVERDPPFLWKTCQQLRHVPARAGLLYLHGTQAAVAITDAIAVLFQEVDRRVRCEPRSSGELVADTPRLGDEGVVLRVPWPAGPLELLGDAEGIVCDGALVADEADVRLLAQRDNVVWALVLAPFGGDAALLLAVGEKVELDTVPAAQVVELFVGPVQQLEHLLGLGVDWPVLEGLDAVLLQQEPQVEAQTFYGHPVREEREKRLDNVVAGCLDMAVSAQVCI